MTLHATPASVPTARRWFRMLTARLDLLCSVDECVLLISELVTNAIAYAKVEVPWLVRIEWYRAGTTLRIEVHNPASSEPVRLVHAHPADEHGRGLLLVDSLSDEWSVGCSSHGGTVVAFSLHQALPTEQQPVS
ncbi:ATP-binding protein [Streptomyces lunaelactis]|uniref:ATP-binding protein n=1 Tax=Streptomyces lunaelactis TaxID=1535768 RepID=A0A2R4T2D1_9ACTN|nr:ATP-binding protein [Streptomyces lunaelactis]AVZ73217.1 ATP-binding protein [Streptomyces lunaelactis]NUK85501.1 ATP-binding protein [Streptomyces lunaelactis]NUL04773.1 ATP-binding protein [Streptomyces lunaelactis]